MWIKAFEDDAMGTPLDEHLPVSDRSINTEKVVLLPGQSIAGVIPLNERLKELDGVLRRRNVILFWSYVPELAQDQRHTRLSGSLMIDK